MTGWRYILASLRQFRRVHLAVAAGVALATAVITGALVVGDSVRGSLRDLALRGLGRIDAALVAEQPFRAALADQWRHDPSLAGVAGDAVPLLIVPGSASHRSEAGVRRAAQLQVIGVTPEFWSLAKDRSKAPLEDGRQIALTQTVAEELHAAPGDRVLVRVARLNDIPADSALGEKDETAVSQSLRVAAVLADEPGNLARFSLRPSPTAPRNVFVPRTTLERVLELTDAANVVALAPAAAQSATQSHARIDGLRAALHPLLADYGLKVDDVSPAAPDRRPFIRISARRLVLPPPVPQAVARLAGDSVQPVVTYLANSIVHGDRRIPYSTVVGVDSRPELGPLVDDAGHPIVLADDEIALNDWAAKDLNARLGDRITLRWYAPETTHGQLHEEPPRDFTLRAIVPLVDAAGKPTPAADPLLAPELPGVTDQESIDNWKLPFELVETIRDQDEDYWDRFRTTPKAFVSHSLATRLWATRWGVESVLRLAPAPGRNAATVAAALERELDPRAMGLTVLPVRSQALAAAGGTTPFDGLFLGFSFFLLASAVMLVALLFRLGVESRAAEAGLLLGLGFTPRRVRRLLLTEGALVAAAGAAVGVPAGAAYARLMIHGLNTWWNDALAAPLVDFHATPRSAAIGFAAGLITAIVVMARTLRQLAALPARQLLTGDLAAPRRRGAATAWTRVVLPAGCLVAAVAAASAAVTLEGEAQAGAFFASGALVLVAALVALGAQLRQPVVRAPASLTLGGLARRNARRAPGRTMLSLALAATASFLLVALSAFRLAPTAAGTGGFDLIATADLPIHFPLDTSAGRTALGFSDRASRALDNARIVACRVRNGEDASCLNLFHTAQPRVLGAPVDALETHARFAWSGASQGDPAATPWPLLESDLGRDSRDQPVIPVVVDRNTALYSLKLSGVGSQLTIRDAADRPRTCQVVALLTNSVLQGDLLVSDANFLRLFPENAGRRFFLIAAGPDAPAASALADLLETQLEDYGFDARDAQRRLADLLAVQNTYLSTFQSLGALGLLLGMVGLAVAQLRSMQERRGELALLQATGFARGRLRRLVLAENLTLLAGGLALGAAAALVAVAPQAAVQRVGVPWITLAGLLGVIALGGAAAARWAAGQTLRAPLIPALRGD